MSNNFLAAARDHNLQQDLIDLVSTHAPELFVDLNTVDPYHVGSELKGFFVGEKRTGNFIVIYFNKTTKSIDLGFHSHNKATFYEKIKNKC